MEDMLLWQEDEPVIGMLGYRTWVFDPITGKLQSLVMNTLWDSRVLVADELPTESNISGVYAHPLTPVQSYPDFAGLVELRGKIVEHEDGTMRGQWCKILELMVRDHPQYLSMRGERDQDEICQNLADRYKVPVFLAGSVSAWMAHLLLSDRYHVMSTQMRNIMEGVEIVRG